jgi:hypothetical protein
VGQEEIGIVDQIPFDQARFVAKQRSEANQRLGSYGWVDRPSGKIHIPIDRAIELMASGQKK